MTIATVTHADPTAELPPVRRSAPPTTIAGSRTPFVPAVGRRIGLPLFSALKDIALFPSLR